MKRFSLLLASAALLFSVNLNTSVFAADDDKPKWDVNNPQGKWNSIKIDTDEVTWSSVDVSPDGKTIIFDALGDIYTMPITGGNAKALTSEIAWNIHPKFSPDGQHIVFISDRNGAENIWTMNKKGKDLKEISTSKNNLLHTPTWSPDGEWIVARKGYVSTRSISAGSLWRFHRSGGDGIEIVKRSHGDQSQKNIVEPAYSSDGRYIYFSQDTTDGRVFNYNRDALSQIYVIQRLDTQTDKTETVVSGTGGAIRPTPSPDGKSLAFIKRLPNMKSAIYVKNLASGNESLVFDNLDRDQQEIFATQGVYPAMAWTPDSNALVFWAGGKIQRVNADGSNLQNLAFNLKTKMKVRDTVRFPVNVAPDEFAVNMTRWAQYSPNGNKIVFQALGYLYIRDAKGGKATRLTSQNEHLEFWPRFSPDGQSIAYTTWDDEDLGSLRLISVNGNNERVITTTPGHYAEPSFSNDGSQLLYRKMTGGYLLSPLWSNEPGIYRVDLNNLETKRIIPNGSNPQFSSDAKRILFSEGVDGTQLALKSVDLNGLDERTHAQAATGIEMAVSPDGKWLAFIEQFKTHLLPFSMTAQTLTVSSGMKSVPVAKLSQRAGEFMHWSSNSDALYWSHGSTLYSRDIKDAFSFVEGAPKKLPDAVSKGVNLSFKAKTDKPTGMLAITGARIVTMRNAANEQEVIENGSILIENNRIKAIGKNISIPEGVFTVDAQGKTIVPGLIDSHAHGGMGMNEIIPQQNWMQMANLAFGVTTIHDPSNDTSEIFSVSEMQRTGQVLAPRVYSTGSILYGALLPGLTSDINSLEDAKFHLQRLKDSGAISVKSYNQQRRDSRQQVISAAEELSMMVVPEGGGKFQHNMNQIVDGHTSIEHSIPLADMYKDVHQMWSQTGTAYSPTLGVSYGGLWGENYWYDKTEVFNNERLLRYVPEAILFPRSVRRTTAPENHYNHKNSAREAKELRDAGVPVLIGAHGQREGIAAHWELWMLEQGGFSAWEALRAATIDPAAFIGMQKDIGSLEVGKLADLVIIDGNPLENLRRSEYVSHTMINGRLYDVATMTEVGSGNYKREPFYFERPGGNAFPESASKDLREKAERHHWTH